ncbi:MAG: RsmB/NOP family class I SAM-dependent RNA methyltransferase [Nanoarchaeota archaeon]|nr:RsmB/NOP family class I SAM-dependent RNA methyltransferase [Nanoarchaeota archaeon]
MVNFNPFTKKRYEQLLGRVGAKKLIEATEEPLTKSLRVNTIKTTPQKLRERLENKGFTLKPIPWCKDGFWVEKSRYSIGATTEYLIGHYFIQSATSMIPAIELDPQPGELVLDMAAAPGGKLTHLAALMKNRGVVVGMDIDSTRMRKLRSNVQRLGLENEIMFRMDASYAEETELVYDKILLDAPCSGEGLIMKKHSQAKRINERRIIQSSGIQRKLVKTAYKVLKKGGELVYSTCTYAPEENELIIQYAMSLGFKVMPLKTVEGQPAFKNVFGLELPEQITKCKRFWPHMNGTEGFFIGRLKK